MSVEIKIGDIGFNHPAPSREWLESAADREDECGGIVTAGSMEADLQSALAEVAKLTGERDAACRIMDEYQQGWDSICDKLRAAESTVAEMEEELSGVQKRLGEAVALLRMADFGGCGDHPKSRDCKICKLWERARIAIAHHDAGIPK